MTDNPAEGETLSTRRLNRALLARQGLLEPFDAPLVEVVERVGGLQTQYAPAAYVGLFSRMAALRRADLTRAMERREVIHGTLMRSTIHSVSAADYWPMAAGIRCSRQEWVARVSESMRGDLALEAMVQVLRDTLSDGPVKARDLTRAMTDAGYPRQATGWAAAWVELVRIPPSGTWERRANDLYELADRWLPPGSQPTGTATEEDGLRLLLERYLGGFGPAKPVEVAAWAGINAALLEPIVRSTPLRHFKDAEGRTLIDLPELPIPPEDTPAPVRFLAQFDATLLVNCRRTQILPERYRPLVFSTKTPQSFPTFTLDGQVAGTWRYDSGSVAINSFATLTSAQQREVEAEAARLAHFHRD